jgi:hypothetical protein
MDLPGPFQPASRLSLLVEGLERAAKALSTAERPVYFEIAEIRSVVAPGAPACRPDMFSEVVDTAPNCLQAFSIDSCNKAAMTSAQGFDVYMLESVTTLYMLEENRIGPVNEDALGFSQDRFVAPSRLAFEDRGVGQATMPMILIYNPEILGELPEALSAGEVLEIAEQYPLVLPPHKGIIGAMSQSLLGAEFDELSPLRRSFYDQVTAMVGPEIDRLVSTGQITSWDTVDLLRGFVEQEIAWTIQDTMFLRALVEQGYTGPVATTRLPIIEELGGTAMMLGWGVPPSSEHPDMAWAFIGELVEDPAVIEWALSNGSLPVSDGGIEVLRQNPQLAEAWLPGDLLAREGALERLIESGAESRAWRLHPSIPIEVYNEQIVPVSIDILRRLFRGEIGYKKGMQEWLGLLEENNLLID